MPVPESGVPAAQGYARASGIPYGDGFVKNRYVGRTFIQPSQKQRGADVRLKLNPLRDNIKGKRLVVVDDSIVRGTTTRQIIALLREAGAVEVHFRVSSPPYRWPCFYGLDTGKRSDLLAADMSVGEIADYLGVDSLAYLDLDRLVARHRGRPPRRSARRASPATTRCRCPSSRHQARARAGGRLAAADDVERRARRPRRPSRTPTRPRDGSEPDEERLTYADAGVDIAAGEKAVELHQGARALDVPARGHRRRRRLRRPLRARLEAATAIRCSCRRPTVSARSRSSPASSDRRDTIGIDCVAMSVDDIAAQGAEPLFFLDYISIGKLVPDEIDEIVSRRRRRLPRRRAARCSAARCRSIPASWSRASSTSSASRSASSSAPTCCRATCAPAIAIIGVASPGLRCNGYSLARACVARPRRRAISTSRRGPGAHHSLGDELLRRA